MIALQINGQRRELDGPTPLLDFLAEREIDPRFVVVEHNRAIVRRATYSEVTLNDGDELEIVQMVAGGA